MALPIKGLMPCSPHVRGFIAILAKHRQGALPVHAWSVGLSFDWFWSCVFLADLLREGGDEGLYGCCEVCHRHGGGLFADVDF